MPNSNSTAGTNVDNKEKAEVTTSSPNNAKPNVMCRIFKVVGFIDERGFDKRIQEIYVKESGKSFIGEGSRISKDKLMKIDTMFYEHHKSIKYHTYCIDGEQQKALDMIKAHIVQKVKKYKSEIDVLVSYIYGT